jgi:hypothetical protein
MTSKITYETGENMLSMNICYDELIPRFCRHDITTPEINKDYYRNFAAEPVFPGSCAIVINVDGVNIHDIEDVFCDHDTDDGRLFDDPDVEDPWDMEDDYY